MKYIVSDEYKFVYLVVQKAACSSIKTALVPLFDLDTDQYQTVRKDGSKSLRVHMLFDNSGYQIGKQQFAGELQGKYRDYFKFAFVRNPWDRLVSCYSQKLLDVKRDSIGQRSSLSPSINSIELYNGMPFDDFVQAIHEIPDEEANIHFRSQCETVCDESNSIMADFVGHFETLEEDFSYVAERIGAPELQLPHLLRSKNRVGRSYSEFYDDRLARLVYERYAKDIALFGYSFSPDSPAESRGSPAVHLAKQWPNPDRRVEALQQRIEKLEGALKEERRHTESLKKQKRRLRRRARNLERRIQAMRSSRTWKAASALMRIKASVLRNG